MATITTRFGSGGANLAPGGAAGAPDLATALRDIADDLADLKPAHIDGDDFGEIALTAAGDTYTTAERDLINALKERVNELSEALNYVRSRDNALAAQTFKTQKG